MCEGCEGKDLEARVKALRDKLHVQSHDVRGKALRRLRRVVGDLQEATHKG